MGETTRQRLGLFALWVAVTAANLFKPYHIDDTAHLIIAQWISSHPLHPMQGLLNWGGVAAPIYRTNQPHLYFYVLAAWGTLFGWSAPAMHGLQSLFAAGCILLFHRLARRLNIPDALWLTAMLALGPAFIVEQNLMVDVPLLCAWLAFFSLLLARRFAPAAAASGAALLMKYSSLILLPVLAAAVLLHRAPQRLWVLLIPIGTLAAWSAFNWWDYGGIHLATALHAAGQSYVPPTIHKHFQLARRLVKSTIAWLVGLGALTPFGVIALVQARTSLYIALLTGFLALIALVWTGLLPDTLADIALWLGFATSGALTLAYAVRAIWRQRTPAAAIIGLWIFGTSAFYIFTAPFIAARHILLILPPCALLLAMRTPLPAQAKRFGLIMSVILSTGLTISDDRFAAFYQTEAAAIPASLPPGTKIWAAGHWGWQWYATRAGMTELDIKSSRLTPGDILVVPEEVDHQLPASLSLQLIRHITGNFSDSDPFCTGRPGRFYLSYTFRGPWSLSRDCSQHIDIYKIISTSN
jgi:hypothetical protein